MQLHAPYVQAVYGGQLSGRKKLTVLLGDTCHDIRYDTLTMKSYFHRPGGTPAPLEKISPKFVLVKKNPSNFALIGKVILSQR